MCDIASQGDIEQRGGETAATTGADYTESEQKGPIGVNKVVTKRPWIAFELNEGSRKWPIPAGI
jgi:hypothetical protein